MRIKIGDTVLDQFNNTVIAQNFEVNEFGDLSTRNGGFSNDFTLPLTTKNENALGFPSDLNISTREPYEKVDAQLVDVGAIVAIGYLRYKKIEDKTIKCAFFEGNTEWFNLIKDKKMIDLDLSVFDHTWDHTTIAAAMSSGKRAGFVYPFIDYGHFVNFSTGSSLSIASDQFFPGIFVHSLVHQIFADIGWTVGGEIHNYTSDTIYREMIQPFCAADLVKTQSYLDTNTIDLDEDGTTGNIATAPAFTQLSWIPDGTDFNVTSNDDYETAITATINYTGADASSSVTIYLRLDGVTVATSTAITLDNGANEVTFNATTVSILTAEVVTVEMNISVAAGIATILAANVVMNPISQMIAGNEITMSSTMPDMLQTDFLQYLFFSLGIVPQTDSYAKRVDLDLFRTIEDNIPSALDWSDKLDTSKKATTDFTKLLNNYSKVSIINYEVDDDDPELSAYKAETQTNFGQGQFNIDNAHLDPRKEIYTAPYTPMINILTYSGDIYAPQIKWFIEDPDNPGTFLKEFEPKPKIALLAPFATSVPDYTNNVAADLDIFDPSDPPTLSTVTAFPFCWFAKTKFLPEIDALLDSLVYDQIVFPNVIGNPLKATYLQDQEDILNEMKAVRAFFRLTEVDIINQDFLIPVYVNKYKSYFYRNKIKNYRGSKVSTEVELIRIGNG